MVIIEEISIKNYRVLQNVTLKGIQPFSIFLGPNGSGKTTFFDVIGFLSDCLTTNVRKALDNRGRFQEVISRNAKKQEIEIVIKYREKTKQLLNANIMESKPLDLDVTQLLNCQYYGVQTFRFGRD